MADKKAAAKKRGRAAGSRVRRGTIGPRYEDQTIIEVLKDVQARLAWIGWFLAHTDETVVLEIDAPMEREGSRPPVPDPAINVCWGIRDSAVRILEIARLAADGELGVGLVLERLGSPVPGRGPGGGSPRPR